MSQTPHTLGAVLSQEQLQHLNRMIGDILGKPQSAYNANSGTVEVLKDLQQLCKDPLPLEREHLGKLFSSREFQKLVRDTAEQQWMVKPGDLKEGDYVGRLYERLNSQMEKLSLHSKCGTGAYRFLTDGGRDPQQCGIYEPGEPDVYICTDSTQNVGAACKWRTVCVYQ